MEFVIFSGLSGAGKSLAIDCFEDLGYYCIDNLPPQLIKDFIKLIRTGQSNIEKIALVMDIRGRDFLNELLGYKKALDRRKIEHKLIFLEASKQALLTRFSQTRRVHPLAVGLTIDEAIDREIEILKPIREIADLVIDTSDLKNSELATELKTYVQGGDLEYSRFSYTIRSFGYKFGLPLEGDFVFDMRFIPNPFYIEDLKEKNGNDAEVSEFVFSHEITNYFTDNLIPVLNKLKTHFIEQGKPSLTIAFGCTGGQHRSVAVANYIAEKLREQGETVRLRHREIRNIDGI